MKQNTKRSPKGKATGASELATEANATAPEVTEAITPKAKRKPSASRKLNAKPRVARDPRMGVVNQGGQWKLITKAQLALITKLASEGKRQHHIADELGITQNTFITRKRDQPGVQEALDRGNEYFHNVVLGHLLQQSKRGNVAATIFTLKARHGYREADAGYGEMKPQIIINLPGALPLAAYGGEVIEHDATQPQTLEVKRG